MQIAEVTEDVALILPLVILVEGIVGLVAWLALGSRGGRAARFAAWVGLVTLTLWCGSALAFVLLHLLLFAFGSAAAMAGAVVVTALMILMPFGWAALIRHHESSDHEHLPR
jgi:Na+-driven multidrug efflux pump